MFSGYYYGISSFLILAVNVYFAVHAYRNGRGWWIFILFFFPGVGALVYFFAEYLPSVRAGGRARSVARDVARKLNPTAEIRRLEDVVALTPTVNNRMELARALLRAGRKDEAVATYRACAQGIHADDPRLLYETTIALHETGALEEARGTYERLKKQTPVTPEQQLLGARVYDELGDTENALREYAAVSGRGVGEEGRVRYALLLKKLGREAEAQALFEQIVRHARLSSSHYRREEKEWIEIARRELKDGEAAAR